MVEEEGQRFIVKEMHDARSSVHLRGRTLLEGDSNNISLRHYANPLVQ